MAVGFGVSSGVIVLVVLTCCFCVHCKRLSGDPKKSKASRSVYIQGGHRLNISMRESRRSPKDSLRASVRYVWTYSQPWSWSADILSTRSALLFGWIGTVGVPFANLFLHLLLKYTAGHAGSGGRRGTSWGDWRCGGRRESAGHVTRPGSGREVLNDYLAKWQYYFLIQWLE